MKENKQRTYYGKVAIVGASGSGKSYLTKTADRETTGFVHPERKPLPYKAPLFKFEGKPRTWTGFLKNLDDYIKSGEVKNIIIDSQTEAFKLLNTEMSNNFSGWDIAKNYNKEVTKYLNVIRDAEKDIIVISHDELIKIDDGTKERRMVVHNKEHEGKVEQAYTIVLFTGKRIKDNKPEFFLKTFDVDSSTKSPEGLFGDRLEIPNSAEYIFNALEEYYIS